MASDADPQEQGPRQVFNILIKPSIDVGVRGRVPLSKAFGLTRPSKPVQGRPFRFGLKFRNIGDRTAPSFRFGHVEISPVGIGRMRWYDHREYSVKSLNPQEEATIYLTDKVHTYMSGQLWISCRLKGSTPQESFVTSQEDQSGQISRYGGEHASHNEWGDDIFIVSANELRLSRTNFLLVLLTLLIFLDGAYGLRDLLSALLGAIDFLLSGLLTLIRSLRP